MKSFVVCHAHKEVLCIGEIKCDENCNLMHPHDESETVVCAMLSFLACHHDCQCCVLSANYFWNLNLNGYKRKDREHGLQFKGPEEFTV